MKKLLALVISAILLAALYSLIDVKSILCALGRTDASGLTLSLLVLVGLLALSSLRLKLLASGFGLDVTARAAVEATFAANALNLVLPAKMGDIAKATMLRSRDGAVLPAVNLSIYEKVSDFFALFVWGSLALAAIRAPGSGLAQSAVVASTLALLALLVSAEPARMLVRAKTMSAPSYFRVIDRLLESWVAMVSRLWRDPLRASLLLILSLLIWAGHFLQIGLMAWALDAKVPFLTLASFLPVVIVAGLVPLTFGGIGTRDAAIVFFLGPVIGMETAAALAVLFWLRYLVPGLAGLPFLPRYISSVRS